MAETAGAILNRGFFKVSGPALFLEASSLFFSGVVVRYTVVRR